MMGGGNEETLGFQGNLALFSAGSLKNVRRVDASPGWVEHGEKAMKEEHHSQSFMRL